jgi:hypothetical protein
MAITDIKLTAVTSLTARNSMSAAITWDDLVALDATEDADIYVTTTGTYGLSVPVSERDSKIVLLLQNTGVSANAAIKVLAGNGTTKGGAISLTLAKSTAAGETTPTVTPQYALTLESALYKHVSGSRKGYINIIGATSDVEVAVIRLP